MAENLSYNEISARLHFSENHSRYLASELNSEKKKSETMAAEIKELKIELNRITDLLKLAVKNMYGTKAEFEPPGLKSSRKRRPGKLKVTF